jgi:hypothetical protein
MVLIYRHQVRIRMWNWVRTWIRNLEFTNPDLGVLLITDPPRSLDLNENLSLLSKSLYACVIKKSKTVEITVFLAIFA